MPEATIEQLNHEAEAAREQGDFDRAVEVCTELLDRLDGAQQPGERDILLNALFTRANAHRFNANLNEALADYSSCLQVAEEAGELSWCDRALRSQAEVYLRQKQIDKAVDLFRRALEFAQRREDEVSQLLTSCRLARALCDAGQLRDSQTTVDEVFARLKAQTVQEDAARANIQAQGLLVLGVICFRTAQYRRARRFFTRAMHRAEDAGLMLPLAETKRFLGIIESEAKDFAYATPLLYEALRIYSDAGYDPGRFDCYLSLGTTYVEIGDLRNARLCLGQALRIATEAELGPEQGKALARLADVEMREGNYRAACGMFIQDLERTQHTQDRQALGYCHRNLATAYRLLGDNTQAIRHAELSIDYFEQTQRSLQAAVSRLELGDSLLGMGDVDKAETEINTAREEFERAAHDAHLARADYLLARVCQARGDEPKAQILLERSIDKQLRTPPSRQLAETRYQAAQVARALGHDRSAMEHVRNAIGLAETLGSRDLRERAFRVLEEYDPVDSQRMKLAPYLPSGAVDELSTDWLDIDRLKQSLPVTVMFVDMRGYTATSSDVDPQDLVESVEAFLSLVVRIVRQHGGTVDKFIGDCVMATFGRDTEMAQGARMAVWAALEIIEQLTATSLIRQEAGARPIAASIGVNTGEVVVGCYGPLEKRDYTVAGYHVNLASRLQSAASEVDIPFPNRLLISDSTYGLVQEIVHARPLEAGELTLKGIKDESLKVWVVEGRRVGPLWGGGNLLQDAMEADSG